MYQLGIKKKRAKESENSLSLGQGYCIAKSAQVVCVLFFYSSSPIQLKLFMYGEQQRQ